MNEKTLYEILEVSENASTEVIEKAYKVLAKKYHPDLQSQEEKKNAEIRMKQINEAYEILGDEDRRKEYDYKLNQKREQEKINNQNNNYNNETAYNSNVYHQYNNNNVDNSNKQTNTKTEEKLKKEEELQRKKMQEKLNKEYENAYYNYLRSLGYKVKHRWTKDNIRDLLMVILIMAIIFVILWFIPPTHDWMVSFYEENPILKTIIDIIVSIITGIFTGIWSFITGLFAK